MWMKELFHGEMFRVQEQLEFIVSGRDNVEKIDDVGDYTIVFNYQLGINQYHP